MDNKKKYEAEIDFMALLKNPLRLFGFIFPLFILLVVVLGIFYVKNLNDVSANAQPVYHPAVDLSVQPIAVKKGGLKPAVDLKTISVPNEELLAKGKDSYTNNCASCHGDSGEGNGIAGASLNPKPRNFKSADGWTNGSDFKNLYKTLQEGIIKNGMAAYEYLPVDERFAIIHYLRSFGDFYEELKPETIDQLDKQYNLSADVFVPHNVPVETAIKGILKDFNKAELKKELKAKFAELKEDEGYKILTSVTKAPGKFIVVYKNLNTEKTLEEVLYNNYKLLGMNSKVLQLTKGDFDKLSDFIKKF